MIEKDNDALFAKFRNRLADALDLSAEQLKWHTRLREDLALDSIGMFELAVALDVFDLDLPDELAWDVSTVGDAYELLRKSQLAASVSGDE